MGPISSMALRRAGTTGPWALRMASSSTTPLALAAASICVSCPASMAMGFSHSTCLPASIIRMACPAWQTLGLAMYTASTVSSAARLSSVWWAWGTPHSRASTSARSLVREYTAVSSQSGQRAAASRNQSTMKLLPMMPKRTFILIPLSFAKKTPTRVLWGSLLADAGVTRPAARRR